MKVLSVFLLLLGSVFGVFAQNEKNTVVLKGYDPVALVGGKQIKGKQSISIVSGRFKYLFATSVNQQKFNANPELYAVQKNGECAFMPGVPGDPELWKIYQGKIYLFGTALCRERFELSAETILHPEKRRIVKVRIVAIVLYEGVELLDFAGPGEVFAVAQTVDGQAGFNVYTVAQTVEPVVSQGFVTIKPQYSFETAPKADIVVFPGGKVNNFSGSERAMTWAKAAASEAEIALSVCNGAFILAKSKLLENKKVTTHWASISNLRKQVPTAIVAENARFVDAGQIITTAGISAGIDGALHVVERLLGAPAAKLTAKQMEYNRQPVEKTGANKSVGDPELQK